MSSSAPGRQPATKFIFITLVLSVVGFGLLIPVLPKLIVEFQGGNVASGSGTYGWIISAYALMQFLVSPILGSLADRKLDFQGDRIREGYMGWLTGRN